MFVVFSLLLLVVVIFIAIKTSGSGRAQKMKKGYAELHIGMTEQEVIDILGHPDGVRQDGNKKMFTWRNTEWKGTARGYSMQRSIIVDFVDGKVTGWDGDNMGRTAW